jgi:hypothetical protein
MGINRESDVGANLQIGPTTLGMVRLYIEAEGVDMPLDFDPDEAEEIAEELRAAAARAREMGGGGARPGGDAGPRRQEARAGGGGRAKGRRRPG